MNSDELCQEYHESGLVHTIVRLDTRFSIRHGKFVFRNIPKMYIQNYKRILGALEIHHQQQCDLKNPQLEYL